MTPISKWYMKYSIVLVQSHFQCNTLNKKLKKQQPAWVELTSVDGDSGDMVEKGISSEKNKMQLFTS
jgi:hypothetical protein